MLTIKLDLEHNNDNYARVLELLTKEGYDISSMAWETKAAPKPPRPGQDQVKNLSAGIDFFRES